MKELVGIGPLIQEKTLEGTFSVIENSSRSFVWISIPGGVRDAAVPRQPALQPAPRQDTRGQQGGPPEVQGGHQTRWALYCTNIFPYLFPTWNCPKTYSLKIDEHSFYLSMCPGHVTFKGGLWLVEIFLLQISHIWAILRPFYLWSFFYLGII